MKGFWEILDPGFYDLGLQISVGQRMKLFAADGNCNGL